MVRLITTIIIAFISLGCFAQTADSVQVKAKKTKQPKMMKIKAPKTPEHIKQTAYIFGCSNEFGDSTLCFTGISKVDSADFLKKEQFLSYRDSYSDQLKDYVEAKLGLKNQTASVFFDTNLKKIQKKYDKMKKKYLAKDAVKMISISPEDFSFTLIEY